MCDRLVCTLRETVQENSYRLSMIVLIFRDDCLLVSNGISNHGLYLTLAFYRDSNVASYHWKLETSLVSMIDLGYLSRNHDADIIKVKLCRVYACCIELTRIYVKIWSLTGERSCESIHSSAALLL